jgi:hypothetical protein
MKALTVRQPWAALIMAGYKDVENRSRQTHYRGIIALHVSLKRSAMDRPHRHGPEPMSAEAVRAMMIAWEQNTDAGHVIGTVAIVGCVRDSESPWAFADHWHWVLANPVAFSNPVPATGKLGLWNWERPPGLLAQ